MFREPFPILHSSDVDALVRFYTEGLGFELTFRWPLEGGPVEYASLKLDGAGLGIGGDNGERESKGFELCVYTDDVDGQFERLQRFGATVVQMPQDQPWQERMGYMRDPDGNLLHLTQPLGDAER
jgi:uncharacterized glyoxalase superfamily protein PhnB